MTETINNNDNDILEYIPDVIIDGRTYFQFYSYQLAKHICDRKYNEYRLTYEGKPYDPIYIYMERLIQEGSPFVSEKYDKKKCLGVLFFDIETRKLTLQKTSVDTEIHEFHADAKRGMNDCFGVQYEIFKHLRDFDLIRIIATERKVRHLEKFIYTITKMKALQKGRFLHFKGYGTQFFIPKSEFKCVCKGKVKKENTKKKGVSKK